MAAVQLNLTPSPRELRQFGWIALAGFALLGGLVLWRQALPFLKLGDASFAVACTLWAIGGASALHSLIFPSGNRPLWVVLMLVGYPIGMFVSFALMGLIFYGLLTPVGLLFRLIGRDSLNRRFEPDAASYWVDSTPNRDVKRYFRQF